VPNSLHSILFQEIQKKYQYDLLQKDVLGIKKKTKYINSLFSEKCSSIPKLASFLLSSLPFLLPSFLPPSLPPFLLSFLLSFFIIEVDESEVNIIIIQ